LASVILFAPLVRWQIKAGLRGVSLPHFPSTQTIFYALMLPA